MKKTFFILFIASLFTMASYAQTTGAVHVNNSAKIDSLVYKNYGARVDADKKVVAAQGFRVQIFSSNRGQEAKNASFNIKKELEELYPDTKVYVTFTAPFWKVRVGDFTDYYTAVKFSETLKESYPERATEIFVVKEDVVKPVYLE